MTDSFSPPSPITRAWYNATLAEFLVTDAESVFARLALNNDFALIDSQRGAWLQEIEVLRSQVHDLVGELSLEFNIPRLGRRIDAVLVIASIVFVVEFKVGETSFDRQALDQVWDYALDLKNFHKASHDLHVVPILIATEAEGASSISLQRDDDGVCRPIGIASGQLREVIELAIRTFSSGLTGQIEENWSTAPYHPSPTIVEAARALYAQHSVEAIARYDAGAKNLRLTSRRVEQLVEEAKMQRRKIICFVTGVPGAGKTLVGLNVATRRREPGQSHAVFLSGNGPLVAVLREALTRDEVARQTRQGKSARKSQVGESVKQFIQNVHHFRDEALKESAPPVEHVVIFDEAQRAWNLKQTASFMQRKKNQPGFNQSEPEFLISYLDRHADWALIVCLVGGGQEINTGEAGIDAWLHAIETRFPHWDMYISSRLTDSEYAAGQALERARAKSNAYFDEHLHLSVSMRSFRAENVSSFVKALLDCEDEKARKSFAELSSRYQIRITRDLARAKEWVRNQARGSERFGLVASSRALRLKPHAIDIRVNVDPIHWFLNGKEDTRSSYYLEDAATEFQVQGLELDWVCMTWDGDMRFMGSGWTYHDFRGAGWVNVNKAEIRNYLQNAYRVLLTRARQGMVVFVPKGDPNDPTRAASYYDPTFEYLAGLGIPCLETENSSS